MIHGAMAGVHRQVHNIKRELHDRFGAEEMDPWLLHVNGALAEVAAAKVLNLPWTAMGALGDHGGPDVGSFIEVRWCKLADGHLLVHKKDQDDRAFLLVTGKAPSYTLRGWALGKDAKLDVYWRPGKRPCYFVPQGVLESIDFLRTEAVRRRP